MDKKKKIKKKKGDQEKERDRDNKVKNGEKDGKIGEENKKRCRKR